MAKATSLSDSGKVTEHIQKLDTSIAETVELVRQIILSTDKEIAEQIKWNSPSFYYSGEMKPFDPKEYKRDLIVMNLHKNKIMLVLPTGAKVKDTSGLLEGNTDGRRVIQFSDSKDVVTKEKSLRKIISEWLKLVDK